MTRGTSTGPPSTAAAHATAVSYPTERLKEESRSVMRGLVLGVALGASGELYGATFGGGYQSCDPPSCDMVYKLAPARDGTWSETPIY